MLRTSALGAVLLAGAGACVDGRPLGDALGTGQLAVTLERAPAAADVAFEGLLVEAYAFLAEPASEPAAQAFVPGTQALPVTIRLDVPGGERYTVLATAGDEAGAPLLRGSATTETPELPARVVVALEPSPPTTPNQPPEVVIRSPAEGARYPAGAPVPVRGTVADPEDGAAVAGLFWTDDRLGTLDDRLPAADGTTGFDATVFEPGEHLLTLTVVDRGGLVASAAHRFEIVDGGSPPPPDGAGALRIDSLSPGTGPTVGGTVLTIRGVGFTPDVLALVGDQLAQPGPQGSVFVDETTLVVTTPPRRAPGAVDVFVGVPDGVPVPAPAPYTYDTTLHAGPAGATQDGSSLHPYGRIQDALARAADGYEVRIARGRYVENVALFARRDVTIAGEDAATTKLRAADAGAPVLAIAGSGGIAVTGVALRGGAAGLVVDDGAVVTATDVVVRANVDGVLVGAGASLALVRADVIENQATGVTLFDGALTAEASRFEDNGSHGLVLARLEPARPATLALRRSEVKESGDAGVLAVVASSDDRVEIVASRILENGRRSAAPALFLATTEGTTHATEVLSVRGTELARNVGSAILVGPGARAAIGAGDAPNVLRANGGYGVSCAAGALPVCPEGGNDSGGNGLGDVDPTCPATCRP